MLIAAGVLVLVVALTALMLWINSRGVFIYIDDVATGRADVARPWREHAARASSYFAWSFGLSLATLSLVLLVLVPLLLAIFTLAREGVRAWTIVVLVACILVLLALMILASLASLALRDFVAPIQLCAGVSCGEALGLFLPLLRMQPGAFALYVLLKICFAVALGITLVVVGCATCCCGFLPVVAQTLLQPALYFERAWPLHMLRAVGYDVMQENP